MSIIYKTLRPYESYYRPGDLFVLICIAGRYELELRLVPSPDYTSDTIAADEIEMIYELIDLLSVG